MIKPEQQSLSTEGERPDRRREKTAPCGLDCFNCEVYEDNITATTRSFLANSLGKSEGSVACRGCRVENGCRLAYSSCETLDCARQHGVEFCSDCPEFPCGRYCPSVDGASNFPHNLKLYNLLRMRLLGFSDWADEASLNRKKYFAGKFIVGRGPIIE